MGNVNSLNKINFEDMKIIIKNDNYLIINTLDVIKQDCLIQGTCNINDEVDILNKYLKSNKECNIVIYGENSNDENLVKKYNQLVKLGFINLYIYTGGMFEWLLLQDIYGDDEFPTTKKELDLLKYKGKAILNINFHSLLD